MSRAPSAPLVVGEVRGVSAGRGVRVDPGAPDLLVAPASGGLARLAEDLPAAADRPAGSRCFVASPRPAGVLAFFRRAERLDVREVCALLVARGYDDVGAGDLDGIELAWGRAAGASSAP